MGDMGQNWVRELKDGSSEMPNSVTPKQHSQPTWDPMLGFPNGRKQRVLTASAEEMEAIQIPPSSRGFCAEYAVKIKACQYENFPMGWRCEGLKHEAGHCLKEDYIIRMKGYERERRLRKRAKRIAEREAAEEAE